MNSTVRLSTPPSALNYNPWYIHALTPTIRSQPVSALRAFGTDIFVEPTRGGVLERHLEVMMTGNSSIKTRSRSHREVPFGLMNFGSIKRNYALAWPLTSAQISVKSELFMSLLRCALGQVKFDERYYLQSYADVADALAKGLFEDAHHHFVEFGYFEDRIPFKVDVDEAFYFWAYPDIKTEVSAGTIPSAQAHFELYGYKEGRLPLEGWSLMAG